MLFMQVSKKFSTNEKRPKLVELMNIKWFKDQFIKSSRVMFQTRLKLNHYFYKNFMWEYLFISKYDFEWTYTMFNPLSYSLEEVNAIKLLNLKQTFLSRSSEILGLLDQEVGRVI